MPESISHKLEYFLETTPGYVPNSNPLDYFANTRIGRILFSFTRSFMSIFAIALIVVAMGLTTYQLYVTFTILIPAVTGESYIMKLFLCTCAVFVGSCIYFNYVQCIIVNPGTTMEIQSESKKEELANSSFRLKEEFEGRWSKFCNKCSKPKPARAHHCHICDKCVLKMDHHCPWLWNCVGLNNQKYFVSFLFYVLFGCSILAIGIALAELGFLPFDRSIWYDYHTHIQFSLILNSSLGLTISAFFGFHLYLVMSNQTTIEFQFNKVKGMQDATYRNPYNLGIMRNVRQVFGEGNMIAYFLPSFGKPPVDGHEWPTIDSIRVGDKIV